MNQYKYMNGNVEESSPVKNELVELNNNMASMENAIALLVGKVSTVTSNVPEGKSPGDLALATPPMGSSDTYQKLRDTNIHLNQIVNRLHRIVQSIEL